jgi:hypothetical protein
VVAYGEEEGLIMTRINREKIVKAAVGSARLEGYKGALTVATEKKGGGARSGAKPKTTAKR